MSTCLSNSATSPTFVQLCRSDSVYRNFEVNRQIILFFPDCSIYLDVIVCVILPCPCLISVIGFMCLASVFTTQSNMHTLLILNLRFDGLLQHTICSRLIVYLY